MFKKEMRRKHVRLNVVVFVFCIGLLDFGLCARFSKSIFLSLYGILETVYCNRLKRLHQKDVLSFLIVTETFTNSMSWKKTFEAMLVCPNQKTSHDHAEALIS